MLRSFIFAAGIFLSVSGAAASSHVPLRNILDIQDCPRIEDLEIRFGCLHFRTEGGTKIASNRCGVEIRLPNCVLSGPADNPATCIAADGYPTASAMLKAGDEFRYPATEKRRFWPYSCRQAPMI
ncbi:hypothetical protein [Breoghania sp.]|uniref:hypothetical protein n=1 Tax=Breoghania sp. TaxID=2065378 RepID=UPI002AA66A73|nr:hypothetical protein [Breoghania sp.]